MRLVTSICAVLALLHPSAATGIQCLPEQTQASGSLLSADISELILVSFKEPLKEVHSKFTRLMPRPITTWSVQNEAFLGYFMTVHFHRKKPVFLIVDANKTPSSSEIRGVRWFTCSAMFLALHNPDMHALAGNTSSTPPRSGCEAGYLRGNETYIQNAFSPQERATNLKLLSNDTLETLRPTKRHGANALGGCELRVACIRRMQYEATDNTCEDTSFISLLTLLNHINVTVKLAEVLDDTKLTREQTAFNTDITFFPIAMQFITTIYYHIPLIHVVYDTFYSRVDSHRVVSLLEIAGECWKIVASTVVLLSLVVLVSAGTGNKRRSMARDMSDTSLFLLAAVLATSADQPNISGRAGIVRKVLFGIWLTALLPLAVYFRTELTAIVMLRRPAYRIDTLQKLEDALDRRQVAPCVIKDTLNHYEVATNDTSLPLPSLLKKLQLAFARQGKEALVRTNLSKCIQCASSPDRVCYASSWLHPSSSLLKVTNVGESAEHLKIKLGAVTTLKLEWLYRPLRRLFLACQEHKLIYWGRKELHYETGDTEFEMSGLLILLVIFQATSCLVLVLELVAARYMRPV